MLRMKPLMVFCVFVYGAWIFLYNFFFRCVECSSLFFGCDVLLFAYAEVDWIRFLQEIVQVLLSFNLIKAQQDYYGDTQSRCVCVCIFFIFFQSYVWYAACCYRINEDIFFENCLLTDLKYIFHTIWFQ